MLAARDYARPSGRSLQKLAPRRAPDSVIASVIARAYAVVIAATLSTGPLSRTSGGDGSSTCVNHAEVRRRIALAL